MKRKLLILFLLFFNLVPNVKWAYSTSESKAITSTVYQQHELEEEGRYLAKTGHLDEAIKKFREALEPKYIQYESDKVMAIGSIADILIWQQKYDEALNEWQWFLDQNKRNDEAKIKADEILALKKYKETQSPGPVHDYIMLLRQRESKKLPPNGYWGPSPVTTILRLYDTIGDHDAGIKFIDEILSWTYDTDKDFKHLKNKINNSKQAEICMELHKPVRERNPDSLACKWLREFLLVREAFEQDKTEGTKGRATKALIQSDYFPW